MITEPRIVLAVGAHALVTGSAVWLIGTSELALSIRIVAAVMAAAVLLPWLQTLATGQLERLTWLALLLVLIIGIGIVEVLATGAQWGASSLLGAAMLEFALLISLSRRRRVPEQRGPAQQ
jgi:hypothetical protein